MRLVRPIAAAALLAALLAPGGRAAAAPDPEGHTTHTVYAGQTLAKIAKRYRISVDALCHANGLRQGARIHAGQKLVIPEEGSDPDAMPTPSSGDRWQDFVEKPRKKGVVTLESPTKHWRGPVLTPRGKVLPRAREAIEGMFASWRTGTRHEIDPRLIQIVVRVSDTFGGRPLRVVSGYREHSFAAESKHKVGRAFDFSIPGIPNAYVRDYLRTLPSVGIGYYPHSTHVHLDVREESAYWMDDAAPGEPPKYATGSGRKIEPADTEPANDGDAPPADPRELRVQ
jgi:uncharacterized protein YcbK (DUF882 family)